MHASRSFQEVIARPKISRNEWTTAERGAFEVGNFALFFCPVEGLVQEPRREDFRPPLALAVELERDLRAELAEQRLGRKRVIQVLFNMSVPRARVPEKASMLRDRSERRALVQESAETSGKRPRSEPLKLGISLSCAARMIADAFLRPRFKIW